jgi:hypothetical protein
MPGHIPNDHSIVLHEGFNLWLEKAMIHRSAMGKYDAGIPFPCHPIMNITIGPDIDLMFHIKSIYSL